MEGSNFFVNIYAVVDTKGVEISHPDSCQQPGMHQPVSAIFLRLAPPFALMISMLVKLAAAKCVKAGHRVPQQGPQPPFLMVSWKLKLLRNSTEKAMATGVIITWKSPEEDT